MPDTPTNDELLALAADVLNIEARAIDTLKSRLNDEFLAACELCMSTPGRVVVTGMGKSGHIAGKLAATLASTGTPAFFVHPAEASHGDMGMITRKDVVIALSNSGETEEIITLLPLLKRLGAPLINMTGNTGSTLAAASQVILDIGVSEEACPLNLAPTASTSAALAMGDALAIALLEARGLKVTMIKLDPYINVDPGTMSPFQHGEVFVTEDGAETDLDLGHYERFIRTTMVRNNRAGMAK